MKADEIIEKLSQEKKSGARFPARIIFTENLSSYAQLVNKLKSACDLTVNISDFCKSDDVPPDFEKIWESLAEKRDKQILVLSAGEYLRICQKREQRPERAQFRFFWEKMQPESSKTRYIMPVFCCRDDFEQIIGKVNERQEDFIWKLDPGTAKENYQISVYSPEFAGSISPDAKNLKDWLQNWDKILKPNKPCSLITKQYKNIVPTLGTVSVTVIDSPFSYLSETLADADGLDQEWFDETLYAALLPKARKGMSFSDLIMDTLNLREFDFVSIASQWNHLDDQVKKLVWIWYRIHQGDDYYSYACGKSGSYNEIPYCIRDELLKLSNINDEWIEQRNKAVTALELKNFDENYQKLIEKVPDDTKLRLLTYQTPPERAYAVKVVSGLLRKGIPAETVAEMLKDKYPALAAYMTDNSGLDQSVDSYFKEYRTNKLKNRAPKDSGHSYSFDRFDSRAKVLHKTQGKDCFSLWVDGFGMEWLPIFLWELRRLNIVPYLMSIATSILPTETEFNHQWDENDPMCKKLNELDKIAHHGMPDDDSYFSCIVYQLNVFHKVARYVGEILKEHEYVAVTGDHGTSRLAALSFQDRSILPVTVPEKAVPKSFGRFCVFDDDAPEYPLLPNMESVYKDGRVKYIVMNNYQHFAVSGNVAGGNSDDNDVVGEVHGGNTPEERLVPVVILKSSNPPQTITCKPENDVVTKKHGRAETNLKFSQQVSTLDVSVNGTPAACSENPDGSWHVTFSVGADKELKLSIVANGSKLKSPVVLKIRKSSGIMSNDMGL